MKRISLKQLLVGGLVFTVATVSILGTNSVPQYKTTTLQETSVKKEVDFTTNWYPLGYAKVGLGASSDVKEIKVHEGQTVSKGDVLVQLIDDTEYNQYKAAQASYYAAIKAKKNAEATPMTPKSTLDTLQGQINAAYYQVKNAEVNLNKKKVKSPISGKVINISVSDYSSSSSASSLIPSATTASSTGNFIIIANTKDAIFTANVSERDIAKLATGMKVEISTRVNSDVLTGSVMRLGKTPVVAGAEDPTYQITVKLNKYPSSLAFGTKFEGSVLVIDKQNVQAVEYDAITIDSDTTGSVLVLNNGKVETKEVTLGAVGDDAIEVTGGVDRNAQIVVDQLPDKKVITVRPWIKKLLRINQ